MNLINIMPLEKWIELEKEINSRSGLNASIFDAYGVRITDYKKWANRLCPIVKANGKGQSFICSLAHQNIATQAMLSREPVIEECDAGLVKLAVPIFFGEEFVGVAGGCGLLLENGEVDTFLIHKTTGIAEEEIEDLSDDIETISSDTLQTLSVFIAEQLNEATQGTKN
ncbi:MAG: hypothetical protein GY866_17450 [Proteobacteria bacterium]|nr:hypothetical protein [Pseudomonadota bacterium]